MQCNYPILEREQNEKPKKKKKPTKLGKQNLKRRGLVGDGGRQDDGGDFDKMIVCMKL